MWGATGGFSAVSTASLTTRRGNQTVKQDPCSAALSTATVPPCNPARSFTITSPSPVPSNFRARPPST